MIAVDNSIPVRRPEPSSNGRTRSIWLWQLALAAVVSVVALAILVLQPEILTSAVAASGVVLVFALTIVTLLVPWDHAGNAVVALIPLGDIVAIALLAYGSELRFGYLWVFPLAWFASSYRVPWMIAGLVMVAVAIAMDALTHDADPYGTLSFLVALLSLTFISITFNNGARRSRAFTRLLRRQSARLEATLERVRAQERRVNQVLNGLDSAVARVDRDGRLLGINDAYITLYGIDRRDTSRPGTSVEYDARGGTALREHDRPAARAARGEIFSDEQLWLFDADGAWHVVSASTRELAHGTTEPPTTLLVVRDVTEAVETESARRTLATTVTHELANPLTSIVGYTDLLLEEDLPPHLRSRLELIEAAGERMERLISQVLRAGGRDAPFEEPRRPVGARALATASMESFMPVAVAGDVRLTLAPGHEVMVEADAFRLRQALDNIISNAVKYTPRAGRVEVVVLKDTSDALIIVQDTGIGIGADDLPRIFDDYFRAETARESDLPGTGLGMRISRTIVEQHGGSIELDSSPGTGTTVTVRLPLRDSNEEGM